MNSRISIASRLERLPWTSMHTKLLALLTLGEFFELYDWFVGGFVAVPPLASYFHVPSPPPCTIPWPYFT
ncbi:hypothetical protein [Vulcanisaeta souniana]|uniref:hypothetical protein n=1 Tax=Vulcanisaeta souniana TaxID=164452 RepID=UPI000A840AEC|nr:hypothetical protein [Vulcanisaeta souniana]